MYINLFLNITGRCCISICTRFIQFVFFTSTLQLPNWNHNFNSATVSYKSFRVFWNWVLLNIQHEFKVNISAWKETYSLLPYFYCRAIVYATESFPSIDRFEQSNHYISYWKLFFHWQIWTVKPLYKIMKTWRKKILTTAKTPC